MEERSREKLVAAIERRGTMLPENEYHEILLKAFVDEFAISSLHAGSGTFGALVGKYAIREDEIKLFDTILTVITTAAGAGFLLNGPAEKVLAAKVSIAAGLFRFFKNIYSKGVSLDETQVKVLAILKHDDTEGRGFSETEIKELLMSRDPDANFSALPSVLKGMTEIETLDGGITKLVRLDPGGRWHTHV